MPNEHLEQECRRNWAANPALAGEFTSFATYLAYSMAEASGRARVCGKNIRPASIRPDPASIPVRPAQARNNQQTKPVAGQSDTKARYSLHEVARFASSKSRSEWNAYGVTRDHRINFLMAREGLSIERATEEVGRRVFYYDRSA
jgi:hypothetical protein